MIELIKNIDELIQKIEDEELREDLNAAILSLALEIGKDKMQEYFNPPKECLKPQQEQHEKEDASS